GEGLTIPTEPHHTPSPQASQSPHHDLSSPSHPTASTEPIPTAAPTETPILRQYSKRATRIALSKALPTAADEPTSFLRDDRQGEAFPTGSMQQKLQELMDLNTGLQRQQTKMATKIEAQDLEIFGWKARIKLFEDKDKGRAELSGDDAPIKGRSMEIGEEAGIARDAEIARIHAKEELKMMIDGLDRSNEVIPKHLHEYEQAAADLTIGEKIELINEMKQFKDFLPMASKEEGERVKRKGLKLEQGSAKKMKTSKELSKEDLKEMMQLVPVEEVYVEALQVKHLIIDWEIHSEGQRDY
nr:hypothetical protein [Tanacetum cinerariifolium]